MARSKGRAAAVVLALGLAAEALARLGLRAAGASVGEARGERERQAGRPAAVGGWPRQQLVLHPYLGFVMDPDYWNSLPPQDRAYPVTEYGLIDDLRPWPRRERGRAIVAIVGGSVAAGLSVGGAEALRSALRASGRFAGREIVLVRAAMAGFKQPQQLMAVNYLLALGAELDAVVNLDGFNEVALHEMVPPERRAFPMYPRGWYALAAKNGDPRLLRAVGRITLLQEERRGRAAAFARPMGLPSAVPALLWKLGDLRAARAIGRLEAEAAGFGGEGAPYELTGPRLRFSGERELYEELARIWKASSLQLARLCRGSGIEYFHFLQPNQYDPGSKVLSRGERRAAFDPRSPYRRGVEKGYPLLRRAGRELAREGVRFKDLSGVFAQERGDLYKDDCCHFNPRGLELLAGEVARGVASGKN